DRALQVVETLRIVAVPVRESGSIVERADQRGRFGTELLLVRTNAGGQGFFGARIFALHLERLSELAEDVAHRLVMRLAERAANVARRFQHRDRGIGLADLVVR